MSLRIMNVMIVCTYTPRYADLVTITRLNLQQYATYRGYAFLCLQTPENSLAGDRRKSLLLVKALIETGEWDLVLMVDGDVLVTNFSRTIEEAVKDSDNVVLAAESFGPRHVNTGVMLFRNTAPSLSFLNTLLSNFFEWRHLPCTFQDWVQDNRKEFEDSALIRIVDSKALNSTHKVHAESDWTPGDWIVHFYWHKLENKEILARAYSGNREDIESVSGIIGDTHEYTASPVVS